MVTSNVFDFPPKKYLKIILNNNDFNKSQEMFTQISPAIKEKHITHCWNTALRTFDGHRLGVTMMIATTDKYVMLIIKQIILFSDCRTTT